jgi:hypothetical protein
MPATRSLWLAEHQQHPGMTSSVHFVKQQNACQLTAKRSLAFGQIVELLCAPNAAVNHDMQLA